MEEEAKRSIIVRGMEGSYGMRSRGNVAAALLNTQQLRLPMQDPPKMKAAKMLAQMMALRELYG